MTRPVVPVTPVVPVYFTTFPTEGLPMGHSARVLYERGNKIAVLHDDGEISWPRGEVKAVARRAKLYPTRGLEALVFLAVWNRPGHVLQAKVLWDILSSEETFTFLSRVAEAQRTGRELEVSDESTVELIFRTRLMLTEYTPTDALATWDARAQTFDDAVGILEDSTVYTMLTEYAEATSGVCPLCWWDRSQWPSTQDIEQALRSKSPQ